MYTHISQINTDDLKKRCTLIHYFGLGFIQIKLGTTHRLHLYTRLLPRITNEEEIHNHRYDFNSTILHGKLHQELFVIKDGATHILEEESCQEEDTTDHKRSKRCDVEKISQQWFNKGSSYTIDHKTFHRVVSNDAITFLTRSTYRKELAEVVRPINASKVCPFSKKVSEEELWTIVDSVLGRIRCES